MTPSLIEAQNLSIVGDGGGILLHSVSFSCAPGERIAVVGPNGAGKTTLAKAIAGLTPRYQGSLSIAGYGEIRSILPERLSRIVSYVPQRVEALPYFTVREFLEMSRNGAGSESFCSSVSELLERRLPQLSGGELQRVLLTGALAQGARLIVLDEPTASLDPRGRGEVETLLMESVTRMQVATVLVTHDISLAARCSERVVILKEGSIVGDLSVASPDLVPTLQAAYGCRFERLTVDDGKRLLIVPV